MLDFKNAHLPELVVLWRFKQWLPTQLLFVIAQNFAPCRIHFGQRERLPMYSEFVWEWTYSLVHRCAFFAALPDRCLNRSNLCQSATGSGGSRKPFQLPVSQSSGCYSVRGEKSKWLQCSCSEKSRGKPSQLSQQTPSPPSSGLSLPLFWFVCRQLARMQNKASVVIGLSGRNLKDLDLFSKSDPYVVISR